MKRIRGTKSISLDEKLHQQFASWCYGRGELMTDRLDKIINKFLTYNKD